MEDNDIPISNKSLFDPLEILFSEINGVGFQSMPFVCQNETLGVIYSLFYNERHTLHRPNFTYKLNGIEVMQAITDPDTRNRWREKVLAEATACINGQSS